MNLLSETIMHRKEHNCQIPVLSSGGVIYCNDPTQPSTDVAVPYFKVVLVGLDPNDVVSLHCQPQLVGTAR